MPIRNLYSLALKGNYKQGKKEKNIRNVFSLLKTRYCNSPVYLGGRTAIVTGGSSGIGFETARQFAARGAKVIIADKRDLIDTQEKIILTTQNENVYAKYLDLASLESIRKFTAGINANEKRLHILVNNAGVGGLVHRYTSDLLQEEMQINHFGPFLLTHFLIDLLKKSQPSRIIFVSSLLAYLNNLTVENLNTISDFPLMDFLVYSNSKLCNIITAQKFAEGLNGTGITCNSLHPGFVVTNMYQRMRGEYSLLNLKKLIYFLLHRGAKTPIEGAQTVLHLALSKQVTMVTGKFFIECQPFAPPAKALDRSFCEGIWQASEQFVELKPYQKLKFSSVIGRRANLL